jgi:GNAT superfamily N-acetyltransferase
MNTQSPEAALLVRRAEVSDLDTLVAMRVAQLYELRGSHPEAEQPELPAATRRYFERALPTGQYASFVAEASGVAVAAAGLFFFERPPMGANLLSLEACIVDVYTHPDWRRRGASRLVVQAAIDFARASGARRVRLGASTDGRPLYEKLGFTPAANEMELPL